MKTRCLSLGGLQALVSFPEGERFADATYDVFALQPEGHADLSIELLRELPHPEQIAAWERAPAVLDNGSTWIMHATEDRTWPLHIGPSPQGIVVPPLPHALVSGDFSHARVFLGPAADDPDDAAIRLYPFDELLLRGRLGERGGLLVHASGVAIDGKGYLFLGDSGAGKSTIATLLEDVLGPGCVYSDDRIVLRPVEGEWRMFGTPWHGTLPRARAGSLPLAGLCFLEQSARNELTPLAGLERVRALLQVYLAPWWLPKSGDRLLRPVEDLTKEPAIGMWRLRFRNDASTSPFLLAALASRLTAKPPRHVPEARA